jgi:hypothetical protein
VLDEVLREELAEPFDIPRVDEVVQAPDRGRVNDRDPPSPLTT